MIGKSALAAAAALTLASCGIYRSMYAPPGEMGSNWRGVATPADRDRLRRWHDAWDAALPAARAADPDAIAQGGALFAPDRALAGAMPPPGTYRCRTYKLGAAGPAAHDFIRFPWSECRVFFEDEVLGLHKLGGTQRPVGLLFRDRDARAIFLGTLVLGDEAAPLRYGTDTTRDMIGYVERVDDARWRLVLPWPRFESKLEVIELVPASE
ncbi:DUF4893 domain-containing protein [Stakelama tenebrarum]|uniref:DUF4893 domain-containing protein n=1 Tax=Stakelama tenebrarum TaxID=2711215 RepID=A0A6G6Y413_9SPHN|nr:DUF4893 domain-containing protein [Sphingosinithalassobacter tenebrarum]QIG79306.1 DUF4893 domain-containing protein [Sphingosinithalassobacter tenebrarum]